ncbi:DUF1403 family protein [Mesorhizobium sp. AR10]|uniref:DUF1403 family protein n=1 Tax=Mesorhizobium sp. AR10 TaxID=2865839 RepID=UPI00215FD46E|nr:DUF1403 family protein [Mesorhizobium sp. AR10]
MRTRQGVSAMKSKGLLAHTRTRSAWPPMSSRRSSAYPPPPTASDRLSPADQRQAQPASRQPIFGAYARAALQAVDLAAELGRRADHLLAVAPKLQAKGADAVIETLLGDDAVVASRGDTTRPA